MAARRRSSKPSQPQSGMEAGDCKFRGPNRRQCHWRRNEGLLRRPARTKRPVQKLHRRDLKIQGGDSIWHLNTNEPAVQNYMPRPGRHTGRVVRVRDRYAGGDYTVFFTNTQTASAGTQPHFTRRTASAGAPRLRCLAAYPHPNLAASGRALPPADLRVAGQNPHRRGTATPFPG
jgi:hypothetical protein